MLWRSIRYKYLHQRGVLEAGIKLLDRTQLHRLQFTTLPNIQHMINCAILLHVPCALGPDWIRNSNVFFTGILKITRHVFVKHGCPRRQQSQTMAKISKSYILTPPHPQGHVMSVKCEQPLDEHTVQIWLLYDHPNFKYCTLFISGTELGTDRRTDGRADRRSKH